MYVSGQVWSKTVVRGHRVPGPRPYGPGGGLQCVLYLSGQVWSRTGVSGHRVKRFICLSSATVPFFLFWGIDNFVKSKLANLL